MEDDGAGMEKYSRQSKETHWSEWTGLFFVQIKKHQPTFQRIKNNGDILIL